MLKPFLFKPKKRYLPIQLDITNSCNLRCRHCYHAHHSNKGALTFEQWLDVLGQYRKLLAKLNYLPMVHICGGEPTLSSHFNPLLEELASWEQQPYVAILSNGTKTKHLDFNRIRKLKNLHFQISLDGPDAHSHDEVRGLGAFEMATSGIRTLKEHGVKVSSLAVLSKANAERINDFFKLGKALNLDGVGFTRLIVEGHAKSLVLQEKDRPLTALELKSAYEQIALSSAQYGIKTNYTAPLFHLVHPRLGGPGLFSEGIVVDYQGHYLASSRVSLRLGHALDEGLEEIFFKNPVLKALRNREVTGCGSCSDFATCGGDRNAAFAHSGDFLGADPGCWKSARTA